jgi:3-dehydroquinate dehydratase-1
LVKLVVALQLRSLDDVRKVGGIDADFVELRVDYLERPETFDPSVLEEFRDKVIVTIRDPSEGGVRKVDDGWKARTLKRLHDMGVKYDVEARFLRKFSDVPHEGEIVSVHYFDRVPSVGEVEDALRGLESAWVRKIAVIGKPGYKELLAKFAGKGFAVMPMAVNPLERIAFAVLGSELVYASLGEGMETAPGQMDYRKAKELLKCLGLI